jgi:lipopolysaccharide export system permease protein
MIKQFIGPFVLMFFIATFILLMQTLWKFVDELIGKGLELSIIGEFLLYSSVNLTTMSFPLAVLVASIFTMSSLGENCELIAFKASGISLQRIVFPLVVMSIVIAAAAFLFANNVSPVATLKMRALLEGIRRQRPELQLREGVFSNLVDGYSIRIGKKNYNTNMLYDLRIYDHTEGIGNISVVLADSGQMALTSDKRFLEITLFSGHRYNEMVDRKTVNKKNNNHPFSRQVFDKQIFRMALPNFDFSRSDEQIFKKGYAMMNLNQLTYTTDSLSLIMENQKNQIRAMTKPAFERVSTHLPKPDSAQRAKIPEDLASAFAQLSKAQRLVNLQKAISDTRTQKDQFIGLMFERENLSYQFRRYDMEWHRKFSLSLACIVLFFIGAPLGAIIRKGGLGTPIIIAVLFFVLYYVISMIGEKAAKGGALSPLTGMWMSTAVVMPISIFLTYKATRDSAIFNKEMYMNIISEVLGWLFAVRRPLRPENAVSFDNEELQPERMIRMMENLSQLCHFYITDHLSGKTRFAGIIRRQQDETLDRIGRLYDHVQTVIRKADISLIRESADEYPGVSLKNWQMNISNRLRVLMWAIPVVGLYFYLKVLIQRSTLRKELNSIITANRNLTTELSVLCGKAMSEKTPAEVETFIRRQLSSWPEAGARFLGLDTIPCKSVTVNRFTVKVQYNPSGIRPVAASADEPPTAFLPCFLCAAHRPPEQLCMIRGDYHLLLNPCPVLPKHLMIADSRHLPQLIDGRIPDMLDWAQYLKNFLVLYSSPCCGASTPDHFHFQAVEAGHTPLEALLNDRLSGKKTGYHTDTAFCGRYYYFSSEERQTMCKIFADVYRQLPAADEAPAMNVYCRHLDGKWEIVVIPRKKDHPDACFADKDDLAVSPGAIDMAGVIVTTRRQDFKHINANAVAQIYREAAFFDEQ